MSTQKKKQTPIEKVAALIVDKRKAFYLFYIIAGIFCAVATGWVQVNNDITSYLPDSSETRTGLTLMNDQFVTYGTGSIMLDNITLESAQKVAEDLEKIDGVTSVTIADGEDGYPNKGTIGLVRGKEKKYTAYYEVLPAAAAAKYTRSVPKEFIAKNGHDVTPAFLAYAKPLVGDLPHCEVL